MSRLEGRISKLEAALPPPTKAFSAVTYRPGDEGFRMCKARSGLGDAEVAQITVIDGLGRDTITIARTVFDAPVWS